ncbi:MAG: hypothetical protein AAFR27_14820 [Pseudomonadota bacterium]
MLEISAQTCVANAQLPQGLGLDLGRFAATSHDMKYFDKRRLLRLLTLASGIVRTPAGANLISLAVLSGVIGQVAFAAAVLAIFIEMSQSLGNFPAPWPMLANLALVLQFPLAHHLLLSGRGSRVLAKFALKVRGSTHAITTNAMIASVRWSRRRRE